MFKHENSHVYVLMYFSNHTTVECELQLKIQEKTFKISHKLIKNFKDLKCYPNRSLLRFILHCIFGFRLSMLLSMLSPR